jgi:hypothetical protein
MNNDEDFLTAEEFKKYKWFVAEQYRNIGALYEFLKKDFELWKPLDKTSTTPKDYKNLIDRMKQLTQALSFMDSRLKNIEKKLNIDFRGVDKK